MSKVRENKTKISETKREWPAVVYFWIIGLAFLGYFIGRIALDAYPHPVHWASGLVGGVLGIGVGWLWYWKRGDVF
jgi:hypothetical protein